MISIHAIILAAGKGTRMNSDLPKVLHLLQGRPMIHYVLSVAKQAGIRNLVVVVGYEREQVKASVLLWQKQNPEMNIEFAVQEEQNGTGHAVQTGQKFLPQKDAKIAVLLGDVPLLLPSTLCEAVNHLQTSAAVVVSMSLAEPSGYGRIVRDASGKVQEIIEEKDANSEQKKIQEVNTGLFVFQAEKLWQYLNLLESKNSQNELYLTDMVKILKTRNENVRACLFHDSEQFTGVNSLQQLSSLEKKAEAVK